MRMTRLDLIWHEDLMANGMKRYIDRRHWYWAVWNEHD
jgi:hypothetical protein